MGLWKQMIKKEDPNIYQSKDSHLNRTLKTRDLIGLGVGTIVSTGIFTLPGVVAAEHAGPAAIVSFIIAAIVAGLSAAAYAEMSAAMPFAGSAYSWINVIFGEFWGWIVGWALLAEYLIAGAFVASGLSANLQGLLSSINFNLPKEIASPLGTNGGIFDLFAMIAIVLVFLLLTKGVNNTTKIENSLVILKVIAVLVFILVGLSAIKTENYVPFLPPHESGTSFGGVNGIMSGVAVIFIAYLGFDVLAASSAEAKNPQKTMPRGIIGSLIVAVTLYSAVSLVLVGMFKYTDYANNAEPIGWALRQIGHSTTAGVIQTVAVVGMFTALIGSELAGSRLLYSFGRDHMLPKWLGKIDNKNNPNNALILLTICSIVIGALLPFEFIAQLVSAGTLVAFMFVSLGVYKLRPREGKDIQKPAFRMPWYPVLPALGFISSLVVFLNISLDAKIYAGIWFIIGIIVYFSYGMRKRNYEREKQEVKADEEKNE